jgi:hypothetical protein
MSDRFIAFNRGRSTLFGAVCAGILSIGLPVFAQGDARPTTDGQVITGLRNGNAGGSFPSSGLTAGDVMGSLRTYHDPATEYGTNSMRWIGSGGRRSGIVDDVAPPDDWSPLGR